MHVCYHVFVLQLLIYDMSEPLNTLNPPIKATTIAEAEAEADPSISAQVIYRR